MQNRKRIGKLGPVPAELETWLQMIRTFWTLQSKVDFRKTQDHTNAENLYMSFAQPTAERLAAEWNLPVDAVRQMLRARNLKPHPHSAEADDGILGDQLYDRTEVDALAPYTSVRGPTDFREASGYEPDLLQ